MEVERQILILKAGLKYLIIAFEPSVLRWGLMSVEAYDSRHT